jgi:hypothetical protein
MEASTRECYGFKVHCLAHPDARDVMDSFFGPVLTEKPDHPHESTPILQLTIDVSDSTEPVTEPPHTVEVIRSDPITIDAGSSHAVIDPRRWTARMSLARKDVHDQVVWGRLILERMFLYLVCRSPRHYPLHAGAIIAQDRMALVSAPTGVGKSTFTYWSFRRGAGLVGEDIIVRHMDDIPGRFWGYPRAVYLAPDLISRCPELDGAMITTLHNADKCRVQIPGALMHGVRSGAHPTSMVFLTRGEPVIRPMQLNQAVERCREDFSTAKDDLAVVADVESDLRRHLAGMSIWELGLSGDLDASYDALLSILEIEGQNLSGS